MCTYRLESSVTGETADKPALFHESEVILASLFKSGLNVLVLTNAKMVRRYRW